MATRINRSQLESLCERINIATGSPLELHTQSGSTNTTNYHISGAYGGYQLYRMDMGDVLYTGHVSPRNLYDAMNCYLRGINHGIATAAKQ